MFTLMSKDVDGPYCYHTWRSKPTKEQLLVYLEGYAFDAGKVADDLLKNGRCSLDDASCTTYEIV